MLANQNNQIFECSELNQIQQEKIREVYICSCGKNYQSFAAVYLHVRLKHGIKLSTTSIEHRKRIINQNQIRKIYYEIDNQPKSKTIAMKSRQLLRSSSIKNQKSLLGYENVSYAGQWMSQIQQCIRLYLQQNPHANNTIYEKFKLYWLQEFENTHKRIPVRKIPQHLNNFMVKYLPYCEDPVNRETQNWHEICEQLFYFAKWLREHRYTEYFVFLEPSSLIS